ncbi:hypothetical protein [Pseudoalteromonas tetraodonis]|uniref:hypothetical protein n=1 Tax=Pseudoalteromonas tetraodonis TaxID=43659 RepID=UPI003002BA9C
MKYKCENCEIINEVPDGKNGAQFLCYSCSSRLPSTPINHGSTSSAVGLIGGAALGASIGGPVGAVVGGVLGAILGKESKGIG